MTQEISSLMDGELDRTEAERAIKACCLSAKEQETWHLYHVIGDSMRGQAPRELAAKHVMDRLEKEPAIIARPKRAMEAPFARVALAAAASVATIGVVGWIGSQGGAPAVSSTPIVAKGVSNVQPVAKTLPVQRSAPTVDVQDYYTAHKQLPYRPVVNRPAQAPAAR